MIPFLISLSLSKRSFEIKGNDFYLDGEVFRFISGEMHYFRQVPEYWEETIKKIANMGCNMVATYVWWNLHEPNKGEYNFTGIADIERFISLCERYNLYVCLRIGPYICGETDYGGLPYWIMTSGAKKLRTTDPIWLKNLDEWLDVLLPMMKKHMYINGGSILPIQIENEYGGKTGDCSKEYLRHLAEYVRKHLGEETVIFTVDNPNDHDVSRGSNSEVALVTTDFSFNRSIEESFALARKYNGGVGPYFNGENHPGYTDQWGYKHNTKRAEDCASYLWGNLVYNASINMYMTFGGTNFGFFAGCQGSETYNMPFTTSYDYDAAISEAGDMTYKYELLRKTILKYYPQYVQNHTVSNHTKKAYGKVHFTQSIQLSDAVPYISKQEVLSFKPKSFEELRHIYGFVVYSIDTNGGKLRIKKCKDRAYILVDGKYINIVSIQKEYDVDIPKGHLEIFIENHGRMTSGIDYFDFKGLSFGVTLNGEELFNWKQVPLELERVSEVPFENKIVTKNIALYRAEFEVDEPYDTFLNPKGFKHGSAFINGFNIGRHWEVGPQLTLYVPAPILKKGLNELIILETDGVDEVPDVTFEDTPILDTIK